ncbi:hypothetical protein [Pantoea sp. A4]|uniref:hypothetical protein n=1 Tax=Pantoea sp. A4 TaxID=1225184 RepID=UPI000374F25B|nr:hypothetical protein [Pantoea sp. A4]
MSDAISTQQPAEPYGNRNVINTRLLIFLSIGLNPVSFLIGLSTTLLFSAIISCGFAVALFVSDRKYLRSVNAYVPHWGWFFLFPVYLFKRQRHNGVGLLWFWMWFVSYVITMFILPKIVIALYSGHTA